jgi:hypothetical protein
VIANVVIANIVIANLVIDNVVFDNMVLDRTFALGDGQKRELSHIHWFSFDR